MPSPTTSLTPAQQSVEAEKYLLTLTPILQECLTELILSSPTDPLAELSKKLLHKSNIPKDSPVFGIIDTYLKTTSPVKLSQSQQTPQSQSTQSNPTIISTSSSPLNLPTIPTAVVESKILAKPSLAPSEYAVEQPATATNAQAMPTPLRLVLCGAACSGKGSQCEFLKKDFPAVHISTGDLLRNQVEMKTELGMKVKGYMDSGNLVPDELLMSIVLDKLKSAECIDNGFILDGFPRSAVQAETLKKAGIEPQKVIALDVPDDVLVERVTGRRLDPVTGKIYHIVYDPPPADISSRIVHRSDDTPEKLAVRLQNYHQSLSAIQQVYKDKWVTINGSQSKETVYNEIRKAIGLKSSL